MRWHIVLKLDLCLSLLSLTSAAAGENFYNEGCPKSLLCGVNFNDTECQLLAGNAYHMATMGQWLFYVLSRAVLLPPSGSFKLCSDLGQRTRSFEDMGDDDHDEGNNGPQMLSSDGEQDGRREIPMIASRMASRVSSTIVTRTASGKQEHSAAASRALGHSFQKRPLLRQHVTTRRGAPSAKRRGTPFRQEQASGKQHHHPSRSFA